MAECMCIIAIIYITRENVLESTEHHEVNYEQIALE